MFNRMCPKCGGDLYLREEMHVNDVACLHCGLVLTPKQEDQLAQKLLRKRTPPKRVVSR